MEKLCNELGFFSDLCTMKSTGGGLKLYVIFYIRFLKSILKRELLSNYEIKKCNLRVGPSKVRSPPDCSDISLPIWKLFILLLILAQSWIALSKIKKCNEIICFSSIHNGEFFSSIFIYKLAKKLIYLYFNL